MRKNIIFLIIIFIATLFFAVGIFITDSTLINTIKKKVNSSPKNQQITPTPKPQKKDNIRLSPVNPQLTATPAAQLTPPKKGKISSCPPTLTDIDDNIYNTAKIGTQCWMKESLGVTKNASGDAINRYCYDNNTGFCNTDGGLYDWNIAMDGSTQEGAQGICPDGWHIPKDSEWYILEDYLKDPGQSCDASRNLARDCDSAGTKLMQKGSSGFEAVIAGARDAKGSFILRGLFVSFWSSSAGDDTNAWYRDLNSSSTQVGRGKVAKTISSSIRCLKD